MLNTAASCRTFRLQENLCVVQVFLIQDINNYADNSCRKHIKEFDMAIENINNRTQNPEATKLPNHTRQDKSNETINNADSDSIEITTAAHEIKTAFESLASIPSVSSERVEAAKAAIANGNYAINAETIAEKMIQLEKTLPDDST